MNIFNTASVSFSYPQTVRWLKAYTRRIKLTPIRITLAYIVLGLGALIGSDILFPVLFADPLLSQLQVVKGGLEVFLTAVLIFAVTNRRDLRFERNREHLERQREELQLLHRVFRHNVRNDINVIQGYAEMAKEEVDEPTLETFCQNILGKVDQLSEYTEQTTLINRITETADQIQPLNLGRTMSNIVEERSSGERPPTLNVDIPSDVRVRANPMLPTALEELVDNAIRHNTAETPEIDVSVDPTDGPFGMVELVIQDNGPGIPETELSALKDGEDVLHHLSGMGLWMVQWTIRNSDGDLWFESEDGVGTTVVIHLAGVDR